MVFPHLRPLDLSIHADSDISQIRNHFIDPVGTFLPLGCIASTQLRAPTFRGFFIVQAESGAAESIFQAVSMPPQLGTEYPARKSVKQLQGTPQLNRDETIARWQNERST